MSVRRISWRWLLAGLAAFLVAGIVVPYFSADGYRKRIGEALEASLGRKVNIVGDVHFDLLRGPGFTLETVEIGDDPAFGVDNFVSVDSLEARLKLDFLWSGKLAWASIVLNHPSVNLVKSDSGHWNFESLLKPGIVSALPKIEMRDYGRVNFRFGDTKSIFYIGNVELDAAARSDGHWDLRFSGEPGRTDRAAPLYRQSVTGRGQWRPEVVNVDLQLDKSALSEVSSLIFGRDVGIHGTVSSRIQLNGPPNDIRIAGRLQVQDLHRWDQMPMKGDGWPLDFRGRLDVTTQLLEMESAAENLALLPIGVRYRVADYLSKPRWALGLRWNRFPVEPLAAIARHMGAALPEDIKLAGTLDGAVSWSGEGSLQGQIAFHEAAVTFPNSTAVQFEEASVLFDGDRIHLAPAVARIPESEASVDADYRWTTQELDLNISSESMTIADIRTHAARLPAPLLAALRTGVWKGKLRYRRGPEIEEGWSGQIQLNKAEIPLPGLAEPLRIRSAAARLDGAKLWVDKMVARIGAIDLQGDYRYEPGAVRPHRFRVNIPTADTAELERLLMPSLRRNEGFLARTLGIGGSAVPGWLVERFMDGAVEIGQLTAGDTVLRRLKSRVRWDGAQVDFTGMEARLEDGMGYGRLKVNLSGRLPSYRLDFHADSLDFKGGKIDADGVIETSGTGIELLSKIRSEGSFSARGLDIGKSASGCYRLEGPRLRFTELQLQVGSELYVGRGATQDDGRLLLQLSNGGKQMRIMGPLAKLTVVE
jgi:hypothetical protein